MTNEELATIEARVEAATPGPWEWTPTRRGDSWGENEAGAPYVPQGALLGETLIQLADTYEGHRHDCAFIAHARTDIPALIAEIRRLQSNDAIFWKMMGQINYLLDKHCIFTDSKDLVQRVEFALDLLESRTK